MSSSDRDRLPLGYTETYLNDKRARPHQAAEIAHQEDRIRYRSHEKTALGEYDTDGRPRFGMIGGGIVLVFKIVLYPFTLPMRIVAVLLGIRNDDWPTDDNGERLPPPVEDYGPVNPPAPKPGRRR